MGESGRIQLQMMLVQQSGQGALPLSILPPEAFLPFIRQVERLTIEERLSPVIVYWSRQAVSRLLPPGREYGTLVRESTFVGYFSEERNDPPDEWCFLVESPQICLVVYGQEALEAQGSHKYQCTGSMEPGIVRESFNRLLPIWQVLNQQDSNRVEDYRVSLGPGGSAPNYVQMVKAAWPVVKAPIQQQGLIMPAGGAGVIGGDTNSYYAQQEISGKHLLQQMSSTGPNKIQPIAMDVVSNASDPHGNGQNITQPFGAIGPGGPAGAPVIGGNGANKAIGSGAAGAEKPVSPAVPPAGPQGAPINALPPVEPSEMLNPVVSSGSNGDNSKKNAGKNTKSDASAPAAPSENTDAKNLIPPAAQAIISDIIGQLRHSSDLNSILQYAIETLTNGLGADRGLIWKVVGDQLAVTNEFSIIGNTCFVDNQLNSQESMSIVLEFLSRFPDESGAGVISIPDTAQDTDLHKMSRTLSSLLELGEVRGRLMVQLRSRGIFSGFLELQQCGKPREWSTEDAVILQKVAEMLSVVVQQSFDQSKIEMDAQEMKLINEIASLFRESKGETSRDSLVKSVLLVADHMGFIKSQIYLFNPDLVTLEPQIGEDEESAVDLSNKDNPFVAVFESGRGKVVNMEYSRKGDPFFKHDMALVLPLISEGTRLGVIGLWRRQPKRPQFRPQDRELGLTIAGHLSNVIRADQAVQQIRADQAREALINKVSVEIKRSLKEADQISDTLVKSVREYFGLDLCVVSQYSETSNESIKCKYTGNEEEFPPPAPPVLSGEVGEVKLEPPKPKAQVFADLIFCGSEEQLRDGQTVFIPADELRMRLGADFAGPEWSNRSVICVPLGQGNNFKAVLLMVAKDRTRPFPDKDMRMVIDMADRVGVVISHSELFATVERQAVTDPMTGLFNRRYFEEQLSKEIDRFQRFGHPFSFIIVDLDYLKKINDTKGHHVGDAAIIHTGNVVRRSVREIDTVGRFGGEEFVVLLPETDLKWAKMVAERICAAIREKAVDGAGIVTGSVGVATFPHDSDQKDRLFELADQALFLAKHRGRNQVCTVTEDLMPTLADGGEEKLRDAMKQDIRMGPVTEIAVPSLEDSIPTFDVELIKEKGLLGMLSQLISAVEERSSYGPERSSRAYSYANRIAQSLHLTKDHTEVVSLAAVLCNLGKMAVPEEVLKKPDPLSEEDRVYINQVPHAGAKFLEPAKVLGKIAGIVEAYKEHWDGSGYPNGLKGDVIPIEARIVSLVDAYTAMTSERPYRKCIDHEQAIRLIQDGAGREWDPRLVKIFVGLLNKEK
ncbi:MAG: diguanylate cyclase [Cyanobacteria bacterium SZAS LIN-3]|nr:diguanylate cyclase [Cyanobacteria bacterium SZAS LIN-3]MBS2007103.1 diguanylate cyclase [Cyanobacteria bacterium SZAS TMP-1]